MRLLKLLAYFALGYIVYEFYQGMTGGQSNWMSGGGDEDLDRALNEDQGRMMNMTGTGRGTTTSTQDASGASIPHLVGRGVV